LIIILLFDIIAGFVLVNRSFTQVYIIHPEIPDNHCERKRAKNYNRIWFKLIFSAKLQSYL